MKSSLTRHSPWIFGAAAQHWVIVNVDGPQGLLQIVTLRCASSVLLCRENSTALQR